MARTTHAMSTDRRLFVALDPAPDNESALWSAYRWDWSEESGALALCWVWSIDDSGQDGREVLDMLMAQDKETA